MAFQVDQCKNFKDGKKCSKCERMMPAYCKDQQDLEDKARLYDEWVASQQIVKLETVVVEDDVGEQETTKAEAVYEAKSVEIETPVVSKGTQGRRRRK